jgi:hypothetical protein
LRKGVNMKNLLGILAIFSALSVANAKELSRFEYDYKAKDLLATVFTHCQAEFAEAMRGAFEIQKANYVATENENGTILMLYTITTIGGAKPPSYKTFEIATLEVRQESILDENAPGKIGGWNYECKLTKK